MRVKMSVRTMRTMTIRIRSDRSNMTSPIDSLPRVTAHDLFITLRQFESEDSVTLENLRLKFCYDRNARRKGDYMFATAVIVTGEMQKLGLIESRPLPKATSKTHEASKGKTVKISASGKDLLGLFQKDRSA